MGWRGSQNLRSGNFLIFRDLHQLVLHDLAGGTHAFTTLVADRHKFAKLLEGLGVVLTYRLPYFFIANAITQTNVHDNSRSVYAQIVNENGYDYNEVKADINSVFRGE